MDENTEFVKQSRSTKLTTYIVLAVLNAMAVPSAFILMSLLNLFGARSETFEAGFLSFGLFFPSLILIPITGAVLLATVIADIIFIVHLIKRKS